ncbi:MAG: carboxylate--amine ligase [Tissierellia bacterium]|nr:carboxylate--amine ligase [Tissierellia bacterium]
MENKFIPIILGTDINAYGTARSFHEKYGINSVLMGSAPLPFTKDSKICDVHCKKGFDTQDVFLKTMVEEGKKLQRTGKKLLLISCSDGYTALITKNKNALEEYYVFNYIGEDLQKKLENKKDFYEICEKYGLDYPKTYIINKENYKDFQIPFDYPVAAKANDSIEYLHLDFPGKKKAYRAENKEELKEILEDVYNAGYGGEMIIQDFIPGGSDKMAVLNCYVDHRGKVKMACLGKCILDECLPESIGNYNALLTIDGGEIYEQYRKFLEAIDYRGFANFDLKFDERDQKYKVFEINIRQGRSSYYMTCGGCNFVQYLVEDMIEGLDRPAHYHRDQKDLWLYADPSVVRKYASKEDLQSVESFLKKKNYRFTQWYEKDRNWKRFLFYLRRRLATIRYYPKFEKDRS